MTSDRKLEASREGSGISFRLTLQGLGIGVYGLGFWLQVPIQTTKVDVRLPGKGNSNSHGARPVHLIITRMKWIRTSRLSIKNSLSLLQQYQFRPYALALSTQMRKGTASFIGFLRKTGPRRPTAYGRQHCTGYLVQKKQRPPRTLQ